MLVFVIRRNGRIKAKIIGCRLAADFVDLMGQLAGAIVQKCMKPEADAKKTIIEVSEKVLIPAYLEGAGCTLKEEYK